MQIVHNRMVIDVNAARSPAVITAKEEDTNSRFLEVQLICSGEQIVIGNNDRIVMMARDKTTGDTVAAVNGTPYNGSALVELSQALLSVPATLECEIAVYGTNGSVLTSAMFTVIVAGRVDSTVVERQEDFSALVSALSDAASTSNRIDEVASRIQPVSLGGTGGSDETAAANSLKVPTLLSGTAISSGADLNTYTTSGTYYATQPVAQSLTNCPVDGSFKLFVMEMPSRFYIQLLIAAVGNTVWFRGSTSANSYPAWKKVLTTDAVIAESGTWAPSSESGTITVGTASYAYDGRCVTIGAKITCGSDISNTVTINGLPLVAKYKTVGSCVLMDSDETAAAVISGTKIQIKSSAAMTNKIIIISATYLI